MNEFMLREQIESTSKAMTRNEKECNIECELKMLRKNNELLQDLIIWTLGFLDGNISKRGEEKP